jgi:hypothetical protein
MSAAAKALAMNFLFFVISDGRLRDSALSILFPDTRTRARLYLIGTITHPIAKAFEQMSAVRLSAAGV